MVSTGAGSQCGEYREQVHSVVSNIGQVHSVVSTGAGSQCGEYIGQVHSVVSTYGRFTVW